MKIKKIHHVTIQYPVNHIADGPTQDAGQGKGKQFLTGVRPQHPDDQACRQQPDGGEKPALPTRGARQEREGGAAVMDPDQVKEAGDHRTVAQAVVAHHQHLTKLVGQQDDGGQGQPAQHAGCGRLAGPGGSCRRRRLASAGHQAKCRVSPAPNRLLVQRPHSVGCAGSVPSASL